MPVQGGTYVVQIGKPIEKLDEEILEIIKGIAFGLITAMLLLVFLSYLIAGKVLKPIGVIDRLAREITDKNLSVRIPSAKEGMSSIAFRSLSIECLTAWRVLLKPKKSL